MSINFNDLFNELETENFDFQEPVIRAKPGKYVGTLKNVTLGETKKGLKAVGFNFTVTAPADNIGETISLDYYPESSEIGERRLGQTIFLLIKAGVIKIPKTKLTSWETIVDYLIEKQEYEEVKLKLSVVQQEGSQYTNKYCNGPAPENYVPEGALKVKNPDSDFSNIDLPDNFKTPDMSSFMGSEDGSYSPFGG